MVRAENGSRTDPLAISTADVTGTYVSTMSSGKITRKMVNETPADARILNDEKHAWDKVKNPIAARLMT